MLLTLLQAYRDEHGLNGIYLIPSNLYGPGDHFEPDRSHVIPALIRRFLDAVESQADKVTVWGSGNATREFLYAPDAAEGIVLATERYDGRQPVNLGNGDEINIHSIAHLIAGFCGFEGVLAFDPGKPDGQTRRCLDTSKAKEFGWEAKTQLQDGLEATVAWYREKRRQDVLEGLSNAGV